MQDKLLESINNNPLNDSKLKNSNSSNFKLSENFNKEKFSQVIKDKQFEIKKALDNFEFNYSNNNRFYNNKNYNSNNFENENVNITPNNNNINNYRSGNFKGNYEEDNKAADSNYENQYNQKTNFYNTTKSNEISYRGFEKIDRGRIRENNYNINNIDVNNANNYRLQNNIYNDNSIRNNIERAERNNYSNNSLRGSYDEYEKGFSRSRSKSRDQSRRLYNFGRNNTNQDASLSKSPQKLHKSCNKDLNNQNIYTGNNYINEIKVNKWNTSFTN